MNPENLTMHPTLRTLIDVLAELDETVLRDCYGIQRISNETDWKPGHLSADEWAPLDAAVYAWIDAGRPKPEAPSFDPALFDAMESALSAALGEVPVDRPPEGETSWEGLVARVARMVPTAKREAELYIELREDNGNEGETWWHYWPADEAGIAIADAIEALTASAGDGCEFEISRRNVPGAHVDAFDARGDAGYMAFSTQLGPLDLELWRAAEMAAEPDPEDYDAETYDEERALDMLSALLYKGKIRDYERVSNG